MAHSRHQEVRESDHRFFLCQEIVFGNLGKEHCTGSILYPLKMGSQRKKNQFSTDCPSVKDNYEKMTEQIC